MARLLGVARQLMRALALALAQPEDFFTSKCRDPVAQMVLFRWAGRRGGPISRRSSGLGSAPSAAALQVWGWRRHRPPRVRCAEPGAASAASRGECMREGACRRAQELLCSPVHHPGVPGWTACHCRYPPTPEGPPARGCGEHTDCGFLTFVAQDAPGIEVGPRKRVDLRFT